MSVYADPDSGGSCSPLPDAQLRRDAGLLAAAGDCAFCGATIRSHRELCDEARNARLTPGALLEIGRLLESVAHLNAGGRGTAAVPGPA